MTESQTIGGKVNWKSLLQFRDKVGRLFKEAGLFKAWREAIIVNNLTKNDMVSQQFTSYDPEWRRMHKAVADTFRIAGRDTVADQFQATVPVYTSEKHPIDFLGTLLKGASVSSTGDRTYAILSPFKAVFKEVLQTKGIHAPDNMEDLSQLMYNNIVAKETERMNFDTMEPGYKYHADEAVTEALVAYVKNLADRKAAGDTTLSKIQDKIATAGIEVQNKLTKTATTEVNKKVGESVIGNVKTIGIVVLLVLILIIYLIFK